MPICYYCEIILNEIPYRCKFCGMIFCNKHRLPENHKCPFDLRKKSQDLNFMEYNHLLYQDALEFVSKELTVAKIYDYVSMKSMSKTEAVDLLNYLIENSDNNEIIKVTLQAFKVLELKSDKVFRVLEACLISEEDPGVKKIAQDVITYIFPKKSKRLLNWLYENKDKLKKNKN
ncbi:MAG: AN1-type zinc finger domain-containing protein [Promethearchaeota archaeon]